MLPVPLCTKTAGGNRCYQQKKKKKKKKKSRLVILLEISILLISRQTASKFCNIFGERTYSKQS